MGYHVERTPILIASLQKEPGRRFTAAELKERTGVPKKFVRRALTVDAESIAQGPTEGVEMKNTGGRWRLWWNGGPVADTPLR